jgi:hypothetical protein
MSSGGSSGGSGGFEALAMMVVVARVSFEGWGSSFIPRDMAIYEMGSRSFSYEILIVGAVEVCTCVEQGTLRNSLVLLKLSRHEKKIENSRGLMANCAIIYFLHFASTKLIVVGTEWKKLLVRCLL